MGNHNLDRETNGGGSTSAGRLSEFGAVDYISRQTFYGTQDSRGTFILFDEWLAYLYGGLLQFAKLEDAPYDQ